MVGNCNNHSKQYFVSKKIPTIGGQGCGNGGICKHGGHGAGFGQRGGGQINGGGGARIFFVNFKNFLRGQIGTGLGIQTGFGAAQLHEQGFTGWHKYWQLDWIDGKELALLSWVTASPKINSSRFLWNSVVEVSLSNSDASVVVLAKWIGGSRNGPNILNFDGFKSSK